MEGKGSERLGKGTSVQWWRLRESSRTGTARPGAAWQGAAGQGMDFIFHTLRRTLKMIFQVNTKQLKPGDSIGQSDCESAIGFTEESNQKEYQFALLQLLGTVQKQLKKEHGRELTVRIVGQELHILTDQESASYNPKRFDAGLRLARRAHRRLMAVNVARLTAADREMYAKNVSSQAFKLSMLRKKEDVPLTANERTTPVMEFSRKVK